MTPLLLAAPISKRNRMIRIAYARGVPAPTIARALGVTNQRVDQIVTPIKMYVTARPRFKPSTARRFRLCRQCGQPFEDQCTGTRGGRIFGGGFCSKRCHGLADRIFTDSDIEALIDLRVTGKASWTGLMAVLLPQVVPVQTIQTNIWRYLARRGELTHGNVAAIWTPPSPGAGNWGRWNWLARNTGIDPQ